MLAGVPAWCRPLPLEAAQPACLMDGNWRMRFGGEYEGRLTFSPPRCRADLVLSSARNRTRQSCAVFEGAEGEIGLVCQLVETTSHAWRPDSFRLRQSGGELTGSNDDGVVRFDDVRLTRERP